jgi:hypothetical protein
MMLLVHKWLHCCRLYISENANHSKPYRVATVGMSQEALLQVQTLVVHEQRRYYAIAPVAHLLHLNYLY